MLMLSKKQFLAYWDGGMVGEDREKWGWAVMFMQRGARWLQQAGREARPQRQRRAEREHARCGRSRADDTLAGFKSIYSG